MAQDDPFASLPVVQRSRGIASERQQPSSNDPFASLPVVASAQPQANAPRAAARQAARPQVRFADDRDALIRTVIGEAQAEPPDGQAAVAAVILNRARQRGMTPSQVVLETNQFEPWGNPKTASRLADISPNDPLYQSAAAQVDRALSGYDPTGGADHFYAPVAQQALGRNAPSWAVGEPTVIGGHNFYSLGGSTEDARMAAAGGVEAPVEVVDEFAVDPVAEAPSVGTRENPIDLTDRNQAILAKKGDWVRLENGDLTRAAADAVEGAKGDQQGSGAYAYTPNAIDAIGAGALAASEQIPFGDEALALGIGALTGEGYDATRDRQQALAQVDRQAQPIARNAGGVAGFATGLLAPGAGYIRGPQVAANASRPAVRAANLGRAGRAAQVGAGYGALYGAGAADDSYGSRLSGLTQGASIGAATGGLIQMGGDRAVQGVRSIVSNPSRARQLSREGVRLTPGQMMADVPVVGPAARALEEGASSIPFVGQPIAGARQQSVESFNVAAINRALKPLGDRVPRSVRPGYDAVEYAQQAFGKAYDNALNGVELQVGQDVIDAIAPAVIRVAEEGGEQQARALTNAIRTRVFRNVGAVGDSITGQQFKAIESELGNLSREAASSTDGASRVLGQAYGEVRDALRASLEKQNPQAAEALQKVNQGYSIMARINDAASSTASFADDGVFTPTQLGRAVSRAGSTNQLARGDALLQDLATAGRGIIPSRTGDSGTATRGAITGLVAAGAAGTPLGPIAAPIIATSIAYSRPMQALINGIYRLPDNATLQRFLGEAEALARDNPALQPYYQEAVRFVTQQEPLRQQRPASQNQTPRQRQAG